MEKEERERNKQKTKDKEADDIQNKEYTYDDSGKVIFVQKPNINRLPVSL